MTAVPQSKPLLQFRFDRKLWQRFVEIAQPYFYPPGARSSAQFLFLILTQLVFVVAFTFFFVVGLSLIGFQFSPKFFAGLVNEIIYLKFLSSLGKSAIEIFQNLLTFLPAYIFLVLLIASSGIFYAYRHKLQGREKQWLILGLLLFLAFIVSSLNVLLSYVFRFIDNALNGRDPKLFWEFLWVYGITLIVAIPILISYRYTRRKLALFWREWLTTTLLKDYFSNRAYYEIDSNAANTDIDNPDQRMTEDVNSFTTTILDLILDILDSVLDLIAFTGILYSISTQLTFGLVGYVSIGSILAIWIGNKLIKINFNQLRLEGDFRYGMVHVRDHAESIAFYRGENLELSQVEGRLNRAIKNYNLLLIWFASLDIFQYAYRYFARLVPYLIVAPLYFSKKVDFGTIGQGIFAFQMVLNALSIIPTRIQDISSFAASIERLGTLYERFRQQESRAVIGGEGIINHPSTHFKVDRLTLNTPNAEQTLFQNLSFELTPPQSLLVVGSSGCGKSSLLRAIAGLWRNGTGTIESPDYTQALFLPQKPYMLLGTLREQLKYPNLRENITDGEIQSALATVNLEDLSERMGGLSTEKDWAAVLSQGEQQRLAFARILLSQPKYVILDEATSALDVTNERRLYELLQSKDITYISVGHRPSLVDYHQIVLDLRPEHGNSWQLLAAEDYQFAS
ncbi:ABC transporter ATP-binding protein/permease [Chamaesiphon sp. VAR_48_metabat_135_sub]|uniref:ABC transporter ATP-binding protein/permease n=1 Tax=Chamaesiphon sp. VAR_48_metabat_135_sub TaxID=2964699 RepID=UPI00286D60F5|nr:ABC transporter ATP-binding protein/permease [Chamaesiphon sp. VAR_48_metabat_135_sub]